MKAGWYWFFPNDGKPEPEEVVLVDEDGCVYRAGSESSWKIDEMRRIGEFASLPIQTGRRDT